MSENTPRGGAGAALTPRETPQSPRSTRPEPDREGAEAPAVTGFSIRWGRAVVAVVGVLALLTAAVTAVIAAVGPMTFVTPLIALVIFAGAVAALRAMAVTRRRGERREQLDAAIAEAMNPTLTSQESASMRRPQVPTTAHTLHAQQVPHAREAQHVQPFDAMVSDARGSGGPRSLQELDADGLPVDLAETFGEAQPAAAPAQPQTQPAPPAAARRDERTGPQNAGEWRPREVPRPKYLEAEKASRPVPEPLRPEEPKPTGDVRLNRAEPAEGGAPAQPEIPAFATAPHGGAAGQALDLDAVLRRRRA